MNQPPVSQRDTQETTVQENNIQEDTQETAILENSDALSATSDDTPSPFSPWIAQTMLDYSRELGFSGNVEANVQLAMRLWQRSGLGEEAFVERLRKAKKTSRQHQGRGQPAISEFFRALAAE